MRAFAAMALFAALCLLPPGRAAAADREFLTSDGVRLHYTRSRATGHTIVLVPGWTMPAWIWDPQIADFGRRFHVIAFDPRGQGDSEAPPSGYDATRRGQDIAELIGALGPDPVLLVGWSLGVLDVLAYVHAHGDGRIAGPRAGGQFGGRGTGAAAAPATAPAARPPAHARVAMRLLRARHVRTARSPPAYLDRLTAGRRCARPRRPPRRCWPIRVPRSLWRDAVYATARRVLYLVTPALGRPGGESARNRPVRRDRGVARRRPCPVRR